MAFSIAGVEFEDVRLGNEWFSKLKPSEYTILKLFLNGHLCKTDNALVLVSVSPFSVILLYILIISLRQTPR